MFCFDLTEKETLEHLRSKWLKYVKEVVPFAVRMVVGTQQDLRFESEQAVKSEEVCMYIGKQYPI